MKKFYNFSFEITHLCNKYCEDCSHRIKSSQYKYMTIPQYEKIFQVIGKLPVSEIEIIGGEPLMHPQFTELMNRIFSDFHSSRVTMLTNGKLLPNLGRRFRERFSRIYITWYEGFNEKEILKVIDEENIFINHEYFIKIDDSKKLDGEAAKRVYQFCSHKVHRFYGTKIYACCQAESIERTSLNFSVHIDIDENPEWGQKIKSIPYYKACQYCIFANSSLTSKKWLWRIHSLRQYMLLNSPLAKYEFRFIWRIWRYFKNRKNWFYYQSSAA